MSKAMVFTRLLFLKKMRSDSLRILKKLESELDSIFQMSDDDVSDIELYFVTGMSTCKWL